MRRVAGHEMSDDGTFVYPAELAYGVAKSGSDRNRRALEMFLSPLEIMPVDEGAVWGYGELRADLKRFSSIHRPMHSM